VKARSGESLFTAHRYDTPHPVIELREIGSELTWRVKAETLTIEQRKIDEPTEPGLRGYEVQRTLRCRCFRCKAYAPRKGGKNINHKFICSNCIDHVTQPTDSRAIAR
jgi:hypothetical protein